MEEPKTMNFQGWECYIKITREPKYTEIRLMDAKDNLPVAKASSVIDGLKKDEIAIKNYSENEGILEVLVDNDVVFPPHREHNGFPIVKLKVK